MPLGKPSKSFKNRLQHRAHKQSRPVPPCMALKKIRIYHYCKNFNRKYFYSPTDPLVLSFKVPTNPKFRDQFNSSSNVTSTRYDTEFCHVSFRKIRTMLSRHIYVKLLSYPKIFREVLLQTMFKQHVHFPDQPGPPNLDNLAKVLLNITSITTQDGRRLARSATYHARSGRSSRHRIFYVPSRNISVSQVFSDHFAVAREPCNGRNS